MRVWSEQWLSGRKKSRACKGSREHGILDSLSEGDKECSSESRSGGLLGFPRNSGQGSATLVEERGTSGYRPLIPPARPPGLLPGFPHLVCSHPPP